MQRRDSRLIWGPLLILGGLLFLLQNLGWLTFSGALWGLLWMAAFGIAGLGFLAVVFTNPAEHWWAAIPGCTLLGLAIVIASDNFVPGSGFGGPLFLGSIAVGFLVVFLIRREHWWALIPGGVMLTLALVAGLDAVGGINGGALFFLGLGATFLVVALLPIRGNERMTWAFIPAAVLIVMGLAIATSFELLFGYIWPVALILGGLFLLWRTYAHRQG